MYHQTNKKNQRLFETMQEASSSFNTNLSYRSRRVKVATRFTVVHLERVSPNAHCPNTGTLYRNGQITKTDSRKDISRIMFSKWVYSGIRGTDFGEEIFISVSSRIVFRFFYDYSKSNKATVQGRRTFLKEHISE